MYSPFFPLTVFSEENTHLKLRKSKYPLEESTQTLEKVTDNDNLFGRKWRSGTVAKRNNPQRGKYAHIRKCPILHYRRFFSQFDHSYSIIDSATCYIGH